MQTTFQKLPFPSLPRMSLIYFYGKFTKKVLIEDKKMFLVKT